VNPQSLIKKQLVVLGTASVLGTGVLAMTFLRVPEAMGVGRYDVTVQFAEGAGIYDGAQVSYLGHPVGKVTSLGLADEGIEARLQLVDDVSVPANVLAEIHSRSAVGEQYVALVPPGTGASPDDLGEGAVIPVDRTSFPVEIGPVLDHVNELVQSLPNKDLTTLLDESRQVLDGRDGDLQSILDGGSAILAAADDALPATKKLLRDTEPLLRSVNGTSAHIQSFTSDLAQVTAELRAGDEDLRTLLRTGPAFAAETNALLDDLEVVLPAFLSPLNAVTSVLATYNGHLASVLSTYPEAVAAVQSVTLTELGTHDVRLTLANADNPPACFKGFLPVDQWRSPFETSLIDTPLLYCDEDPADPRNVRGARNIPCPDDPARRAPTPALCRD